MVDRRVSVVPFPVMVHLYLYNLVDPRQAAQAAKQHAGGDDDESLYTQAIHHATQVGLQLTDTCIVPNHT